ncbi:MAG TPA: hypothetical protein VGD74_01390 [Vulgatibacter sp.]
MRSIAAIGALLLLGGCAAEGMGVPGGTGGAGWNDTGGGGDGGTSRGAGGSGGRTDEPGSGGAAGSEGHVLPEPRCTAEELARAEVPPVGAWPPGFKALRIGGEPIEATVFETTANSVRLRLDSGEAGSFAWPGLLPLEIADGSRVRIATRSLWQILVSDAGSLAVLYHQDLGGPPRATFPGEHAEAMFAVQCYFAPSEWGHDSDDCSRLSPPGSLMSVVAGGVPLGSPWPKVIDSGRKGTVGGWVVHNHWIRYLPGYSDESCILESGSTVLVTAHTSFAEAAPF